MKCPRCWAEEAYVRRVPGWRGFLLSCLFLTPLKCNHCYHKFSVPWFFTLGKATEPPTLPFTPRKRAVGPSYAARYVAATRGETQAADCQEEEDGPARADAA